MTCKCRPRGESEVGSSSKAFEFSAMKEGRGRLAPGHCRLSPPPKRGNHCTSGWAGLDAILHVMEILSLPGFHSRRVQSIVILNDGKLSPMQCRNTGAVGKI